MNRQVYNIRTEFVRRTALLLVTVSVLWQVASVAHFALVRHVQCAAHGHLVDAEELQIEPASSLAVRLFTAASEHWTHDSHEHAHCVVSVFQRDSRPLPGSFTGLLLPPFSHPKVIRSGESLVFLSRSERLLLAPKNSPPV